ncbi:MAG: hypothetical protein M1839_004798 [Geoglossum umbratile]|nr:MAG: hypothetical protein M1839_004798 [Geoglossum umbratile]
MSGTLKAAAATAAIPALLALVWVFAQWGGSRQLPVGTAQIKPRTLRIFNIPGGVSKSDFEAILARVAVEVNALSDAADQPGLLGWSFAPAAHSEGSFVATATFRASPAPVQLEAAIRRSAQLDWGRLRVDIDFFGLTPLADPTNPAVEYVVNLSLNTCQLGDGVLDYLSTNCLCEYSIIAVTGLAGHAFGSWVSRNEPSMWLRDFLPESIAKARILSYGYDTKLPGSRSTTSILELSRKFLESVKAIRSQQEVGLCITSDL